MTEYYFYIVSFVRSCEGYNDGLCPVFAFNQPLANNLMWQSSRKMDEKNRDVDRKKREKQKKIWILDTFLGVTENDNFHLLFFSLLLISDCDTGVERNIKMKTMKRKRDEIVVAFATPTIWNSDGRERKKKKEKKRRKINESNEDRIWNLFLSLSSRLCARFVLFAIWIQNIRKNLFRVTQYIEWKLLVTVPKWIFFWLRARFWFQFSVCARCFFLLFQSSLQPLLTKREKEKYIASRLFFTIVLFFYFAWLGFLLHTLSLCASFELERVKAAQ